MRSLLQESALSGKRAEPEHFSKCPFTGANVLSSELAISELSGKPYRNDEQVRSLLSGKTGHKSEFVLCHETQQVLALAEAEHCEVTGSIVRPGILQACEVSRKRVLPNQLERCSVTGKLALSKYFVASNISSVRLLESAALRSASGRFCTPQEGRKCFWTGGSYHPEDLCTCAITGLQINLKASTPGKPPQLGILADLLNGDFRPAEESRLWDSAAQKISAAANVGKTKISAAALSHSKKHLAVVSELKTLFGMRIHHLGAILSVENGEIVGRIGFGKRTGNHWVGRSQ